MTNQWQVNSDEQERNDHSKLAARLHKQCPEILQEWTSIDAENKGQAREHLLKHGLDVPVDAGLVSIGPNTIRQLNLFSYKIALGFFFEHFQMPMPPDGLVSAIWRTKEDFGKVGPPKVVLDMMPEYASLRQGKWDTGEQFEYKYSVNKDHGIMGSIARFRRSLYVTSFAIKDPNLLPEKELSLEWITPPQLLSILERPEFKKRLQ